MYAGTRGEMRHVMASIRGTGETDVDTGKPGRDQTGVDAGRCTLLTESEVMGVLPRYGIRQEMESMYIVGIDVDGWISVWGWRSLGSRGWGGAGRLRRSTSVITASGARSNARAVCINEAAVSACQSVAYTC